MELQALLEKAEPILRQAGELVRSMAHPKVYTKEGHANFVTEADLASQKFLLEHLSPLVPGAHFFAEEQKQNRREPGYNWVIDPIDGTTNFIRGYQPSAISVGLGKDGQGVGDFPRRVLVRVRRGAGSRSPDCAGAWNNQGNSSR